MCILFLPPKIKKINRKRKNLFFWSTVPRGALFLFIFFGHSWSSYKIIFHPHELVYFVFNRIFQLYIYTKNSVKIFVETESIDFPCLQESKFLFFSYVFYPHFSLAWWKIFSVFFLIFSFLSNYEKKVGNILSILVHVYE